MHNIDKMVNLENTSSENIPPKRHRKNGSKKNRKLLNECLQEPYFPDSFSSGGLLNLLSAEGGGEYPGCPSVQIILEAVRAIRAENIGSLL